METNEKQISNLITGEVDDDMEKRKLYSHDASMFELVPELVVSPRSVEDIRAVVNFVASNKHNDPELSIVVRSGGTCMSGGAIGQSIVIDIAKYLNKIGKITSTTGNVQPGVFYRDFEPETLKQNVIMPSYPASRELCTVGGMVSNNAGGEKSLQFGKTEKFVNSLKVVFADGNEYVVRPLNKNQLDEKMRQTDFEGGLYSKTYELITKNYEAIMAAKPQVSKDSTGYHLWNVWDKKTGSFDLTQLIVGSQGTLGIVTDIDFRLVPAPKHSGTLVIFLKGLDDLAELTQDVLKHKPAAYEGFDNYTLMLSFKLFFFFHKNLGWLGLFKLGLQLLPDLLLLARGIPKMVLLVEFDGDDPVDIASKVHGLRQDLSAYKHETLFEEDENEAKSKKFWIMRRESFNLLRQKVKDKHTAPFMDDLIVKPEYLPEFLPQIRQIIKKYKLLATIAGHMGDGNFHIIPLMKIEDKAERAKLQPAMKEINKLVLKYNGSLSGEHNDGMIRGPWLSDMYGQEMFNLFKKTKHIFDPKIIFNPHKKTDAEWEFSMDHLRKSF
jgi:FAD/FMN-containing dehydrogenase